jgi:hypothetical protein
VNGRRAGRLLAVTAGLTAATALVLPKAAADPPAAGYRLVASAAGGIVYANDPTFLVPYADQIVSRADAELSAVGAHAVGSPLEPGSLVGVVPTLLAVGCPTCPPLPALADLEAEARPPASERDEVGALAGIGGIGWPVSVSGPTALATAHIGTDAAASASTGQVAVLGLPLVSVASSRSTLVAPDDDNDVDRGGRAEAEVRTDVAGVGLVARATVLPEVSATIGVALPGGRIADLPIAGMPLAGGTVLPAVESGPGFARAGIVFERIDPNGTTVRIALAMTSVQLFGHLGDDVATTTTAPTTTGTSAIAPSPALGAPMTRTPSPVLRPAAVLAPTSLPAGPDLAATPVAAPTALGRVGDHLWLLWLYLGWLALGALTTAVGHRYHAPRLAAQRAADRRARSGRVDHLDEP